MYQPTSARPSQSASARPSQSKVKVEKSDVEPAYQVETADEESTDFDASNSSLRPSLSNAIPTNLISPPRWISQIQARLAGDNTTLSRSEDEQELEGEAESSEDDDDESDAEGNWGMRGLDSTATTLEHSFDSDTDASLSKQVRRSPQGRMDSRSPSPRALKARRKAGKLGWCSFLLHALARLLIWAAVIYAGVVYFVRAKESRAIGYCDTGTESNRELIRRRLIPREIDVNDVKLVDLVPTSWLPNVCTPCPAHAECRHGAFRGCSSTDYLRLESGWSSLPAPIQAFMPLEWHSPACVPDTHKLVLALELGGEVERILADQHGQVKCGITPPFDGAAGGRLSLSSEREDAGALPASQLQEDLWERMEGNSMDLSYFHQLWDLALSEYMRAGDIRAVPGSSESNPHGLLIYSPRGTMSMTCRARLAARAFLRRVRILGLGVLLVSVSLAWLKSRVGREFQARAKANHLSQVALTRLKDRATQHLLYPEFHPNPWIATTHLRDELLAHNNSLAERKQLWAKVSRIVEENTNVRTRQGNVAGDWVKAWEWIGSLSALPPAATAGRKSFLTAPGTPVLGLSPDQSAIDADQTGASATAVSRILPSSHASLGSTAEPQNPDHSALSATEASRFLKQEDPDLTGASTLDTGRFIQSQDPDRTGLSAIDASRVLQPAQPDMTETRNLPLQGQYF